MLPSAPHSPSNPELHHLSPADAYALSQQEGTVFIDVRMELEHFYVGHPARVINIPWQDYPEFEINPDFVKEVSQNAGKDQQVLLICRSGHRSIDAGNALLAAGFQRVAHVVSGFEGDRDDNHHRSSLNGWRKEGLPWVQC
ncbi:rhodanese-like domain-containing protein [Magnetofaba australis]|uniref:Putative rhodanese n=1 Tax=Magnetofaba australis IT-1 TaxID=1434232 RepID=A0A1Y2K951_9PROT|nr:rhodanese-like domain-containing protein [Magnetofaba australis]OSM06996.1 putative rhodanese [Magnetofaba australis IT-1]